MAIALQNVVAQSSDPICAEVDGEVVMMSIAKGNYYGLDAVGGRVWQLIATPSTVAAVCETLMAEFAVERAACEADVLRFLEDLRAQGLIEVQ